MKQRLFKVIDEVAKNNGYIDANSLLMDYSFIPTVLTPRHKKIEIVKLFIKSYKNRQKP